MSSPPCFSPNYCYVTFSFVPAAFLGGSLVFRSGEPIDAWVGANLYFLWEIIADDGDISVHSIGRITVFARSNARQGVPIGYPRDDMSRGHSQ